MVGSMRTFSDRQTDGRTEAILKDQTVGPISGYDYYVYTTSRKGPDYPVKGKPVTFP